MLSRLPTSKSSSTLKRKYHTTKFCRYSASPAKAAKTPKSLKMVIFGPPGSGKGTQTEKIKRDFRLPGFSTGDLLRKSVADGSPLGNKVKDILAAGKLVDDATMLEVIKSTPLVDRNNTSGWVLDGYPRTIQQAQDLDALLESNGTAITIALMLDVEDEVIIERLSRRLTHVASGRIYNLDYNPPKVAGKDDVTGEPLIQRSDDKPESIKERLSVYRKATAPLLTYYHKKGILKTITAKTSHEGYKIIVPALTNTVLSL